MVKDSIEPEVRSLGVLSMMMPMPSGGCVEPFKDYQDIKMGDLRTAVDFLSRYEDIDQPGEDGTIGVVIKCEGDISLHKQKSGKGDRFFEMKVAMNHSVWKGARIPASEVLGLPLFIHTLPHNSAWDKDQDN